MVRESLFFLRSFSKVDEELMTGDLRMGFSYYPRHHLKLGERATHTGINSVDLAIFERERGEFCCLVSSSELVD